MAKARMATGLLAGCLLLWGGAGPALAIAATDQRAQHANQFICTGRSSLTASQRSVECQLRMLANWLGSRGPSTMSTTS